ncbi:MAG: DUF4286 family protein [Lachnoclostridium sp.]|nr:DUF4286 family protein [Lachnoclostridium sp.]
MIILNTTFHAEKQLASDFTAWLRDRLVTAIKEHGVFEIQSVSRLLLEVDEGLVSYAVRVAAPGLSAEEALEAWNGGHPAEAIAEIMRRHNGRVVYFTTPMEDIAL